MSSKGSAYALRPIDINLKDPARLATAGQGMAHTDREIARSYCQPRAGQDSGWRAAAIRSNCSASRPRGAVFQTALNNILSRRVDCVQTRIFRSKISRKNALNANATSL